MLRQVRFGSQGAEQPTRSIVVACAGVSLAEEGLGTLTLRFALHRSERSAILA